MANGIVWEGNCYIGVAGADPANVAEIGSVLECSLDQSKDAVDVTSRDSEKNKEYLPGLRGSTVNIKVLYELTNTAGQEVLWTAFYSDVAKTSPAEITDEIIAFRTNVLEGTNNGYGFYFDGFLTGVPVAASVGDKVELTLNVQVTGAVTRDSDSA